MWDEWIVDCKLQGSGGEDLGRFLRERLQTSVSFRCTLKWLQFQVLG